MYFLVRLRIRVFGLAPSIIRFPVLRSRMLNKVCVDQRACTKSAFADPRMWSYLSETHFLIRLRRRFYDVPILPRGYQAGDLRMS